MIKQRASGVVCEKHMKIYTKMKNTIGLVIAVMVIAGHLEMGFGQNLDKGLIAYYPFNGNANDASGNGNNGRVNGATLAEDRFGRRNHAYGFDGNDDVNFNKTLITTKSFAISFWFKNTAIITLYR